MIDRHPHPDVTLFLDHQGVIQRAAVAPAICFEPVQGWIGRPWIETVDPSGSDSLRRMVDDARLSGVSSFLQINQLFPSGRSLPIEYTTVRLGADDSLLAVGRSLQAVAELQARLVEAQQAMERDYWKIREIETRYRLLLRSSTDAVMLLRADSLAVLELNPVAANALGLSLPESGAATGRELLRLLETSERDRLRTMLGQVAQEGEAPATVVHLGPARQAWLAQASLLSAGSGAVYLLRLTPNACPASASAQPKIPSVGGQLERMPDGFVMTDRDGLILRANQSCLELMQMPTESSVIHERLGRWLGRPGADLPVLLANVRRLGAVRLFFTTLHGELGTETEVEVSAVGDVDVEPEYISLILRDVGRRLAPERHAVSLGERLGPLVERVGQHPLRNLVDEAVEIVERHYIEEALAMTGGNRTAAAELLGLSRQSLYVKLGRYGLEAEPARAHHTSD